MAGTAAKPTDRRQPHSCILEVPAPAHHEPCHTMLCQVNIICDMHVVNSSLAFTALCSHTCTHSTGRC